MSQTTPGRRLSGRRVRLDTTTVLAVLLPLLTVGALLLVRGGDSVDEQTPADEDQPQERHDRVPLRAPRRAGGVPLDGQ